MAVSFKWDIADADEHVFLKNLCLSEILLSLVMDLSS